MIAGKAKDRITIERGTVTTDDYGGEVVTTWVPLCHPWADINYGKGDERRQAAQESASLTATFRVRANPTTAGVTTKDRIMFDGGAWDITSNVAWLRADRDITAVRAA